MAGDAGFGLRHRDATRLHYAMRPSPLDTRKALDALDAFLAEADYPETARGTAGLAIAEALNNVVEHATTDVPDLPVDIHLRLTGPCLEIEITDRGRPMPGLSAPAGQLPPMGAGLDDLPEGGFGWFLIRNLTDRLRYAREDGANRLTLTFSQETLG